MHVCEHRKTFETNLFKPATHCIMVSSHISDKKNKVTALPKEKRCIAHPFLYWKPNKTVLLFAIERNIHADGYPAL